MLFSRNQDPHSDIFPSITTVSERREIGYPMNRGNFEWTEFAHASQTVDGRRGRGYFSILQEVCTWRWSKMVLQQNGTPWRATILVTSRRRRLSIYPGGSSCDDRFYKGLYLLRSASRPWGSVRLRFLCRKCTGRMLLYVLQKAHFHQVPFVVAPSTGKVEVLDAFL